jgi:hypothetical protein
MIIKKTPKVFIAVNIHSSKILTVMIYFKPITKYVKKSHKGHSRYSPSTKIYEKVRNFLSLRKYDCIRKYIAYSTHNINEKPSFGKNPNNTPYKTGSTDIRLIKINSNNVLFFPNVTANVLSLFLPSLSMSLISKSDEFTKVRKKRNRKRQINPIDKSRL